MTTAENTSTQKSFPASQDQFTIIDMVVTDWQADIAEGELIEGATFADQLKAWFDNQMDELHDSRGDDDYQGDIAKSLRNFKEMIQQIKGFDYQLEKLEAEIASETTDQD